MESRHGLRAMAASVPQTVHTDEPTESPHDASASCGVGAGAAPVVTGSQPPALSARVGQRSLAPRVYGTRRRCLVSNPPNFYSNAMMVVYVQDAVVIHIHGTGIDMVSAEGNSISTLNASTGGEIHANASSYFLKTGTGGTVTRVNNGSGHVHAPYLWEHISDTDGNPGTVNTNFASANGADQTTAIIGTSDGYPHTAVYRSTCPTNARWYGTTDKVCRSQ